jgi:hypothetical protein
MGKKLGQTTARQSTADFVAASQLRFSILDEERLRRSIADDEEVRRTKPDVWRRCEASRLAESREIVETNRRLRALGLEPLGLRLSLAQRRQKLQRLERRNAAEIATFRQRSSRHRPSPRGTPLARRRSTEDR